MISIKRKKAVRNDKSGSQCSHCSKASTGKCQYCSEAFCKDHLKAKPSSTQLLLHDELPESIKQEVKKEANMEGGHSCGPYTDVWLEKKGLMESEEGSEDEPKSAGSKAHAGHGGKKGHKKEKHRKGIPKKPIYLIFILTVALAIYNMSTNNSVLQNFQTILQMPVSCSDGTLADSCSYTKPFYCFNATLIEKSSICGCPDGYYKRGESCGLPNSCIDKTQPGQCSARKPYFCVDGSLVPKASLCGCSEYMTPEWAGRSPLWIVTSPTLYSNPKWYTNNLTFTIARDCDKIQRDNMLAAISYLSKNTNTSLTFTEVEDGCPEITVKCLNVTSSSPLEQGVAETVLTKKNEEFYSVITKAEITVTLGSQSCIPPVTQIHQILHALGFAHVTDPTSMLYYKFGCLQTLKNETKRDLAQIYPRI